jgi:hypothetical protein
MKDQSTKNSSSSTSTNKSGHLRLTKQENAYFEQLFTTYAEPDRARKDTVIFHF